MTDEIAKLKEANKVLQSEIEELQGKYNDTPTGEERDTP